MRNLIGQLNFSAQKVPRLFSIKVPRLCGRGPPYIIRLERDRHFLLSGVILFHGLRRVQIRTIPGRLASFDMSAWKLQILFKIKRSKTSFSKASWWYLWFIHAARNPKIRGDINLMSTLGHRGTDEYATTDSGTQSLEWMAMQRMF